MPNLLIIGGSDAGISAALRARELDQGSTVTVLVADHFPNYSICGLPFYLSGEVLDRYALAHRTVDEIESRGIRLQMGHQAMTIDPLRRTVTIDGKDGRIRDLEYEKLIIATGACSFRPPIGGLDLPGVFTLRWMEDGFALQEYMKEHHPRSVLVIGSGYIGMEMVDAFCRKGLSVTMFSRSGRILKSVDQEMGRLIRDELINHNVKLVENAAVEAIKKHSGKLVTINNGEIAWKGDMVLVAAGALPQTALASKAGIATGENGAIQVNRSMETNVKGIYAAGDCVQTWHRLLEEYLYLPLGTTAHRQGRVAGENAAGGQAEFAGSLGTQVIKIFDIVVARTGLLEDQAREAGFDALTADLTTQDHKEYYPGATPLRTRLTGDRRTHRLLGAQIVGHYGAEISKRIDIFATALFNGLTVESLTDLDLSYTPPLSSPWDPIQMASLKWIKALGR